MLKDQLAKMARAVKQDEPYFGVLSTGERCAVALVLNRMDLLPDYTALEAMQRVENGGWPLADLRAAQREVLDI